MSNNHRRVFIAAVASLFVAGICLGGGPANAAGGVILWNTLDSVYDVEHSRIGPNGTVVGSAFAFEAGQFAKGYVRKSTGSNYIRFPVDVFNQVRKRGTAALWVNPKVQYPQPYDYGIFGLINGAYVADASFALMWGDTVTGGNDLHGAIFLGTGPWVGAWTVGPRFIATPGVPFHAAMAWDIDGIERTADTLRVYRDGVLITKSTEKWNTTGAIGPDFILGASPDGNGFDKYIVDNLVLYDYAKTDFSDRFYENPLTGTASLAEVTLHLQLGRNEPPAAGAVATNTGVVDGVSIVFGANLVLSAEADGIDPLTEAVRIDIGDWRLSVPAGSFVKKGPCFEYEAATDQGRVFLKFREIATNTFRVTLRVAEADLPSLDDPLPVTVQIGNDVAGTEVDLRGQLHGVSVSASAATDTHGAAE